MIASTKIITKHLVWVVAALLVTSPFFALAADAPGYDFETIFFSDCQVGNLNPPVEPPVPGIFMGDEQYAYHIFPADQCDCSEDGFILESITQYLFFDELQVPADLLVQGALLKADFDPSNDCWVPGPLLYEGPQETFTIVDPGSVVIQVPTPNAPALPLADHYYLVMRYLGGAEALLVVDDEPMPCTEFINRGSGWEDLYGQDKSGGGKVIVFGDIVCSPTSVPTDNPTWGGIKSLYK